MIRAFTVLLAVLLMSCATAQTVDKLIPDITKQSLNIRAEMPFSVDGLNFVGVAAIERKAVHILKFNLPKNVTQLQISTCSGDPIFYAPANPFVWEYRPVHFLEDVESCPLKIEAVSKDQPLSLAVIEFYGGPLDDVKLPAWLTCNRVALRTGGGSICQVSAEKNQLIVFDEIVIPQEAKGCNAAICEGAICKVALSSRYCTYYFYGTKSKQFHRLLTRGLAVSGN